MMGATWGDGDPPRRIQANVEVTAGDTPETVAAKVDAALDVAIAAGGNPDDVTLTVEHDAPQPRAAIRLDVPDLGGLDVTTAKAVLAQSAIRAGEWDPYLPALALEISARMHTIDGDRERSKADPP